MRCDTTHIGAGDAFQQTLRIRAAGVCLLLAAARAPTSPGSTCGGGLWGGGGPHRVRVHGGAPRRMRCCACVHYCAYAHTHARKDPKDGPMASLDDRHRPVDRTLQRRPMGSTGRRGFLEHLSTHTRTTTHRP